MKKFSFTSLSAIISLSVALIVFAPQIYFKTSNANAQVVSNKTSVITRLTNYAWSENIGWLSFKDGNGPVVVDKDGYLSGYAWSEHTGWLQFGGLSDFPASGGNARVEGGNLTGWARFVAGTPPQNGAVDNRGGWDGWISLKGSNYGVTISNNVLSGYAWGSDVVGWVDMSGIRIVDEVSPCIGPYGTSIPEGESFTFYSDPDENKECLSEVRICSNGVLSGSYEELGCREPISCSRAGLTVEHGKKGSFYSAAIAKTGQSCEELKAELRCDDGTFLDAEGNVDTKHKYAKCINNPSYIEQ